MDRTFAEEFEERLRVHYMYLKSILSTHPDSTIRELKWTQSDVVTWFKEAKIKKRSKKVVTCNVQFPPLSFIHVPFEVLRVIINDAFCESPHATIHSALRATITGAHVVEVLGKRTAGGCGSKPPQARGKRWLPPPTVRFSEQTSNPRTMRTVSCGALRFFWPPPQTFFRGRTKAAATYHLRCMVAGQG